MPTYDYECDACGHKFEHFQGINDPHLTDCPACKKKKKLRRLIGTGGGLLFKGSGFYKTDYRSDSYTKAAKADSSKGESKSESKAESKTDSKPKPDSKPSSNSSKSSSSD